jgi:hypothetical protein
MVVVPLTTRALEQLPPSMHRLVLSINHAVLYLCSTRQVIAAIQRLWVLKSWPFDSLRNFVLTMGGLIAVSNLVAVLLASLFVAAVCCGLLAFLSFSTVMALQNNSTHSRPGAKSVRTESVASADEARPGPEFQQYRRVQTIYTSPSVSSRQSSPERGRF